MEKELDKIVALTKFPDKVIAKSFQDTLEERSKAIFEEGKTSVVMKDSYGNSLTAIGTQDKVESFTNYGLSNDSLNWSLWLALYNDSWVFRRAIDKPSQDMVRTGLTLNGEKDKTLVYAQLKKFQFDLIQILQWGALFGGSVGIMMFDNIKDEDYAKQLNKKKIKESKAMKIYVTDRWYGVSVVGSDTVVNMASLDYGKPKYYNITFADGHTLKVHHDYVLRYEHRVAPKLVKNGHLQGWGYAEGAHILNELSRDDQLKSAIQSLVNKSLIEVIKMSGMRGVFMGADSENQIQLEKRLEMVNWGRSYNSLTFLDKDDEYQEHGFSGLNGLAQLLEQNMWLISAALEMQGVLYGDLKQGFSNDTDALERYDETILNRCESYYRPILEKLLTVLYIKYDINEEINFTFNSLLVKKHDEEKMDGLKNFVELLGNLQDDGVIDTQQYAKILQNFSVNGKIEFTFTDEEIDRLRDRVQEEMEDIDLENPDDVDVENVEEKETVETPEKKQGMIKKFFNKG